MCRELPLCLPIWLSSSPEVWFSIWLEPPPLVLGSWAAWRGKMEHAGSGQGERDQADLQEASSLRLAFPWVPGTTSGFSHHCPARG